MGVSGARSILCELSLQVAALPARLRADWPRRNYTIETAGRENTNSGARDALNRVHGAAAMSLHS